MRHKSMWWYCFCFTGHHTSSFCAGVGCIWRTSWANLVLHFWSSEQKEDHGKRAFVSGREMMRCGWKNPEVKSQLTRIAHLGAVSKKPEFVCCVALLWICWRRWTKCLPAKMGYIMLLPSIICSFRKPIYNVMGRTDTLALLRPVLPRIVECLDLKWLQVTHYLRAVSKVFFGSKGSKPVLVVNRFCF